MKRLEVPDNIKQSLKNIIENDDAVELFIDLFFKGNFGHFYGNIKYNFSCQNDKFDKMFFDDKSMSQTEYISIKAGLRSSYKEVLDYFQNLQNELAGDKTL